MDGGNPADGDDSPAGSAGYPRRSEVHGRSSGTSSRPPSPWRRRLLIGVSTLVLLALSGGLVAAWKLNSNILKVDVSDALGDDRPTRDVAADGAVNLLLVGSDTREGEGNDAIGAVPDDPGQHSDTNLLVHLSADRTWATVVSIPRDSMTPAPPQCSTTAPRDQWVVRQWNRNYAIGGAGCLIRTLEGVTGVFVDHYAVVDFRGFQSMVDALGGVEICTAQPIDDADSKLRLAAGRHRLQGEQALAYVRTRKSLGDGSDLGRIERQQAFLASVAQQATSTELLTQPTRLFGFLDAATKSLTTDPEFGLTTMQDLAESVRGIGLDNIQFLTVPTEPYAPDQNRVQWQTSAEALWAALREDRMIGAEPTPGPSPSSSTDPLTVSPEAITVELVNGTGTNGLASQASAMLSVQGFTVSGVGNAVGAGAGTLVEFSSGQAEAAATVAAAFPGSRTQEATGLGETVRVTLGPGAENPVEVPNRVGSEPLPTPSITAPSPTPTPTPTITARAADEDICS